MTPSRCLVVDEDSRWLELVREAVEDPRLLVSSDPRAVPELLQRENVRLLVAPATVRSGAPIGLELLRRLRSHPRWLDLPVLVLIDGEEVGTGLRELEDELAAGGATLVLTKGAFLPQARRLLGRA
jgi:CheY-like chemotaxis protein